MGPRRRSDTERLLQVAPGAFRDGREAPCERFLILVVVDQKVLGRQDAEAKRRIVLRRGRGGRVPNKREADEQREKAHTISVRRKGIPG